MRSACSVRHTHRVRRVGGQARKRLDKDQRQNSPRLLSMNFLSSSTGGTTGEDKLSQKIIALEERMSGGSGSKSKGGGSGSLSTATTVMDQQSNYSSALSAQSNSNHSNASAVIPLNLNDCKSLDAGGVTAGAVGAAEADGGMEVVAPLLDENTGNTSLNLKRDRQSIEEVADRSHSMGGAPATGAAAAAAAAAAAPVQASDRSPKLPKTSDSAASEG